MTVQAAGLALSLMDAAGAEGRLPASEIKVGTPLEVGADGALYPFGTSGVVADSGYLLVHVLPVGTSAERVVDGDAAGAWRIRLDPGVEAYVASGALRAFDVTD